MQDKIVYAERIRKTYDFCLEPKMIYELNVEHDYRRNEDVIEEVNRVVGEFLDANK